MSDFIPGWRRGDEAARAELTPMLRRQLSHQVRRFTGSALDRDELADVIEETLLTLANSSGGTWPHRSHLMAEAAPIFRRILLRQIRARGGGMPYSGEMLEERGGGVDLLQLDDALVQLAGHDPDQARIAELRLFGGLSIEEVAAVRATSPESVRREWGFARAWLFRHLTRETPRRASGRVIR